MGLQSLWQKQGSKYFRRRRPKLELVASPPAKQKQVNAIKARKKNSFAKSPSSLASPANRRHRDVFVDAEIVSTTTTTTGDSHHNNDTTYLCNIFSFVPFTVE